MTLFCLSSDCIVTEAGMEYIGTLSVHDDNGDCQFWSDNYPHYHSYTADNFPDATLGEVQNYCRCVPCSIP